MLFLRRAHNTEHPFTRLSQPGTHFTAESTETMRIKSLAQGENILMLGIEPSTFVSKIDILTTTPIVLCGVPRRSILWQKLSIIYINEICNISPTLKFKLLADDTNIFYSGNNINNMCKSISRELSIVNEWFCVNNFL